MVEERRAEVTKAKPGRRESKNFLDDRAVSAESDVKVDGAPKLSRMTDVGRACCTGKRVGRRQPKTRMASDVDFSKSWLWDTSSKLYGGNLELTHAPEKPQSFRALISVRAASRVHSNVRLPYVNECVIFT